MRKKAAAELDKAELDAELDGSEKSAAGVGAAATRAVVLGCEAILVLDAFWAVVLL